jgi:hypothetical protein
VEGQVTTREQWDRVVAAVAADVPGFEVGHKDESGFQRFLGRISFWNDYMSFNTTMYPVVWFPDAAYVEEHLPVRTLQHEWVHLKDAATFFGWLPFLPARVNAVLFNLAYLMPQPLALLALLAFWWPPALAFLLLVAPVPAPFRMWAELRAYRRSLELNPGGLEGYVAYFLGPDYYFMWPFAAWVRRKLAEPSPYKAEMDAAL